MNLFLINNILGGHVCTAHRVVIVAVVVDCRRPVMGTTTGNAPQSHEPSHSTPRAVGGARTAYRLEAVSPFSLNQSIHATQSTQSTQSMQAVQATQATRDGLPVGGGDALLVQLLGGLLHRGPPAQVDLDNGAGDERATARSTTTAPTPSCWVRGGGARCGERRRPHQVVVVLLGFGWVWWWW